MYGLQSVGVHLKGPGAGRESALREVAGSGLKITYIRDVTPIPHNGCRVLQATKSLVNIFSEESQIFSWYFAG